MTDASIATEGLLDPIEANPPCGEDLRDSGSPHRAAFVEARVHCDNARSAERQAQNELAVGNSPLNHLLEAREHWQQGVPMLKSLLQEASKDVEVACMLTDGLARLHDLEGMAAGLEYLKQLLETFWDDLYPTPDPEETKEYEAEGYSRPEDAVKCLAINALCGDKGRLSKTVLELKLLESGDKGVTAAVYNQLSILARDSQVDEETRERRFSRAGFTEDEFKSLVSGTPTPRLQALKSQAERAIQAIRDLESLLSEKVGYEAPTITEPATLLEDVLAVLSNLLSGRADAQPEPDEDAAEAAGDGETAGDGGGATGPSIATGAIRSRADAFEALLKIADFFERTEPHSPIAAQVRRAVEWGERDMRSLFKELITDGSARERFGLLTGIELDDYD